MYVFRSQVDLNDIFGLHFFLASDFRIYQLVTYMFMHATFEHIFFNMFALWMFGCVVEREWGPKKFLFYYISCGIGAGLLQELAQYASYMVEGLGAYDINKWTTVGASGAVYALLLAFGMIFPEERMFIFPLPIPIKAKWFVIFYAALSLVMALTTTGGNVAHFAHLGGMAFGFIMIRYWKHHPYGGSARSDGQQFFDHLREKWEEHSRGKGGGARHEACNERQSDWDYNARKQREQEEIDKILDKIRKSGYDSLTSEEKQKLFDSSNRR